MSDPLSRHRARFAASALAGLALASASPVAAQPANSPTSAPSPPPPDSGPPSTFPLPPTPAADIQTAELPLYTDDLRLSRPHNEVVLLARETALSLAYENPDAASGCPLHLNRLGVSDGMESATTLYSQLSVQASAEREAPVCVYYVSSYPQGPPAFLGRRLAGERGAVRAALEVRSDWGVA